MKSAERVIICEAGPVGIVSALALVRQGIPVTVLEAFAEPSKDPRAATIHPSTLEMLDTGRPSCRCHREGPQSARVPVSRSADAGDHCCLRHEAYR